MNVAEQSTENTVAANVSVNEGLGGYDSVLVLHQSSSKLHKPVLQYSTLAAVCMKQAARSKLTAINVLHYGRKIQLASIDVIQASCFKFRAILSALPSAIFQAHKRRGHYLKLDVASIDSSFNPPSP